MASITVPRNGPRRSAARFVLSAGLVVAAIGLLIQFLTGVPGFPPVPPGPIILLVAAGVVALVRWRWAPVVGLVGALFITVGLLLAGTSGRLTDVDAFGPFAGTWLQVIGLAVALIAAVAALVTAARNPLMID